MRGDYGIRAGRFLYIKVAEAEDIILWKASTIDAVWLPCTHMYLRRILIAEVPKQEDITVVMVTVGRIALVESHPIEARLYRMAHDFYLIECYLYVLVHCEHILEISEILLF